MRGLALSLAKDKQKGESEKKFLIQKGPYLPSVSLAPERYGGLNALLFLRGLSLLLSLPCHLQVTLAVWYWVLTYSTHSSSISHNTHAHTQTLPMYLNSDLQHSLLFRS